MTDELIKTSDMVRETAKNSASFYTQVADHIEQLENTIIALETRIQETDALLKREQDDNK